MRNLIHATLAAVLLAIPFTHAHAQITLAQLKTLDECALTRLYEQAPAGAIPLGYGRGHVLLMINTKTQVKARLANTVWKGKHFDKYGDFINQWPGFRALSGHAEHAPSWYDGKSSISVSYARGTPVFGNTRDEMREIAPGLYLCRLYELGLCPRFRAYFVIEVACR